MPTRNSRTTGSVVVSSSRKRPLVLLNVLHSHQTHALLTLEMPLPLALLELKNALNWTMRSVPSLQHILDVSNVDVSISLTAVTTVQTDFLMVMATKRSLHLVMLLAMPPENLLQILPPNQPLPLRKPNPLQLSSPTPLMLPCRMTMTT